MASNKKSRSPGKRGKTKAVTNKKAPLIRSSLVPVVGIGASAGGLKAFERFFYHTRPDSEIAFVLVPHLDPGHASTLPDLLRKFTKMPVVQARDGMKVQANKVHVIPPNMEMVIMHGTLLLKKPKESRGPRLPIDTFFRSLAEDQRDKAVCIILSGSGSDGTLGLKAIKGELGMAMAQDPASAEYDSMPKTAIETGLVDYILAPEKMPDQLIAYVSHLARRAPTAVARNETTPEVLQKIFQILRSNTGHDFSFYKRKTLCRRIERRMSVHQIERLSDYVTYLNRNPQEVGTLFKELLIGVTNFFRDQQAFEALSSNLAAILADKPKDYAVRVWVPGCSSGEEVYSIAIILRDCMERLKQKFTVQIFGTDIDPDAINAARAALYPGNIVADVAPERLKRFFIAEGSAYRIKKEIREMAVFATQDVLKDPPFTKLDLMSCRNLLIYLDAELQKKLLPLFHYSLKPEGLLFLGSSESINGFSDLFSVIEKKWKLFKRRHSAASTETIVQFPSGVPHPNRNIPALKNTGSAAWLAAIAEVAQKQLADHYGPPCVFIDQRSDVVYTHGKTGKYIELAQGQASLNLLEMARDGIRHELAAAIRKSRLQRKSVVVEGMRIKTDGGYRRLTMTITPMRKSEGVEDLLMVAFEDIANEKLKPAKSRSAHAPRDAPGVSRLEQELKSSQEHLQTTIEELETSNEELQSTNEELQSSTEELETSKEELQSLNEELVTVNAELEGKIEELSRANDEIKNLLDSTKIATIFLDDQLCINRFTSEASKIINLIPGDIGRPISHIVSNLEHVTLSEEAQEVIDSLVTKEHPVRTKEGRWYLSRIIPYRTLDNQIGGVVITFTDITEQKMPKR